MRWLVTDVGNTHVHAVWLDDRGVVQRRRRLSGAAPEVASQLGGDFERWVLGSVHPRAGEIQAAVVSGGGPSPLILHGAQDFPMPVRVRHPETVGVDRLAAALAAHRQAPAQDSVVVDCGTAVTVDWVAADGGFEGGAIALGRRAASRALSEATAQLPMVETDGPPRSMPGRSTEEALAVGVDIGHPGMVDALVDGALAVATDPLLWLTGGDAEWFARRSRHRFRRDEDLVPLGLWWAARERAG